MLDCISHLAENYLPFYFSLGGHCPICPYGQAATGLWQNVKKYVCLLHDNLVANVESMFRTAQRSFIFQQDNAPLHRAAHKKLYLSLRGVPVLPWPAQSPDMNIIESIWLFVKNKLIHD